MSDTSALEEEVEKGNIKNEDGEKLVV